MAYKRYNSASRANNYRKGRLNRAPRKNVAEEAYEAGKYEIPREERASTDSLTLQAKAYRDLANIGSIDVKADPNAEMSFGSFPYTIIGRTSPVIDAAYPGRPNIAGNSITMIQNDTTHSQLMNTFDVAVIIKKLNYCYLPIRSTGVNLALVGEMIKSIEQAISFGFSTMLTQLPFASATYASDMPVPSTLTNAKASGYYKALIHYQCVQQAIIQPIAKYIELRSLEKELMRMSFRTEAPLVTQMFGLFKKASFISVMNTVGTVVLNEYFDLNWYRQMNTLLCVPSRKTVGMVDPLLTIVGVHAIPSLTISTTDVGAPYYDSTNLKSGDTSVLLNPETYKLETGSLSLEQLVTNVCKLMNPAYILRFLRLMNRGALQAGTITTVSAYVEACHIYMQYIAQLSAVFSTAMSDVRTFLDKLGQSGMIYWKKGCSFFVDKIVQLSPSYNALLNDVFQASYAAADKVVFDAATKRWRAWALWNKYTGIPEFDRISGGSFLTFGLRTISNKDSTGNDVNFEGSAGLIPVLFSSAEGDSSSLVVTRGGSHVAVTASAIDNSSLAQDPYLVRLNPLNNSGVSIKQPQVETTISDSVLRARWTSAALLFLGNAFGFGRVKYSTTYSRVLDPDYVAFIDLEIEDVSNQMIVFARNYAPFRVSTPQSDRTIGFSAKSAKSTGLREVE